MKRYVVSEEVNENDSIIVDNEFDIEFDHTIQDLNRSDCDATSQTIHDVPMEFHETNNID